MPGKGKWCEGSFFSRWRNKKEAFCKRAEIFGTLITGSDPRPGSRPVHFLTLGTLHQLFGSLLVLRGRQKIEIRISDMTLQELPRICISG